jgi:type IV pilus assembly protein PilV
MTTFNSFPVAMRGTTMLEVLITIVILAFGLLGVVGLQSKMQIGEVESYQRAQAILLLQDMVDRINANRPNAPSYVSGTVFGTGHTPGTCPTATGAARDQCEWSYALLGAAEKQSTTNLGAMIGARGCVELVQAANPAAGVCTPGIYLVSVAWQGFSATNTTVAPAQTCGTGQYSDDKLRRVIAARVMVGLPECS